MPNEAKFIAIDLVDPKLPVVQFTLQNKEGEQFTFRHPNFQEFITVAAPMVVFGKAISDSDELLNIWFDFDPIAF